LITEQATRTANELAAHLASDRQRDMAEAQGVLRGGDISTENMYQLAERLKRVNEFGLARRLFGRVRRRKDWQHLSATAVRAGQRHALATYKDSDLSASERFTRALAILDEVDELDFAAPSPLKPPKTPEAASRLPIAQRQESYGLRGAVYKRRWQIDGQRGDLERSLGCYLVGYDLGAKNPINPLGVETDQGYTGINAAYVLDLLARENTRESQHTGIDPLGARQQVEKAHAIRTHLASALPALAGLSEFALLNNEWWFHATLAEAYFGLGRFGDAVAALRAYNAATELTHAGPPLERVAGWEFESTITQLMSLANLHADLAVHPRDDKSSARRTEEARATLREYLGAYAPALDRAETGKLGLALSGGGFRASLFHIGVLAALAERDLLRHVEVLSCVSGGSIIGAHFYLEVQRLLTTKPDARPDAAPADTISRDDYLDIVECIEREFVAGVQTNIRGQVFGSIWSNIRAFLQPGYTTTRRLGVIYERQLFARVNDGRQQKPRYLRDLRFQPNGEPATFNPKNDNWRRGAKVPILVLNATTLNTGHNWQFTGSWMGEPPISLDAEIEGNYQLRRMYHDEAPRLKDVWRNRFLQPFAPPDYQQIRLGEAVAASSCVPSLFEPLVFPDLYDGKVVRLVDGGVHDNQGIASLLEQDCTAMIVSDASGQMETEDDPSGGRLGVSLRAFSVSMTRVRQAQFRELAARRRSGLLKSLAFLHLKKDLDADPVDWRGCLDPYAASDEVRPADSSGVITSYWMYKSVQRLLAGLRTDLDAFTDVEASALMLSGYSQACAQLDGSVSEASPARREPLRKWRFLAVEPLVSPGADFERVSRQLCRSAHRLR
jgi:predicted acylesterase/phospholipase RssA